MSLGNEDCEIIGPDNREVEQNEQESKAEENQISSESEENDDGMMEDDDDEIEEEDDVAGEESIGTYLNCQVCCLPLTIPVFECDHGHSACLSCCHSTMIKNMCRSCSFPIDYKRCRAMEKHVQSFKLSCTNKRYGCKETMIYNKQQEHKLICIYEPCSCPHHGCDFKASDKLLYTHYFSKHSRLSNLFIYNSVFVVHIKKGMKYLVLQETFDKTIFLLHCSAQNFGNMASITCIAPSQLKKGFKYELVAEKGQRCVKLESFTEIRRRWSENLLPTKSLLVPSGFLDYSGEHYLRVRIWGKAVDKLYPSAQGSEPSLKQHATIPANNNEPKDVGTTNVSSESEQPYSKPTRSRKAPKWLHGFQR